MPFDLIFLTTLKKFICLSVVIHQVGLRFLLASAVLLDSTINYCYVDNDFFVSNLPFKKALIQIYVSIISAAVINCHQSLCKNLKLVLNTFTIAVYGQEVDLNCYLKFYLLI